MAFHVRTDVPLAPLTTLEMGGPAHHFATARDEAELAEALSWAENQQLPTLILGGGSNLIIPDRGFAGLAVQLALRGVTFGPEAGGEVVMDVAAGEPWDEVVAAAVARGLAGLECLSGIPGTAGATPVQNVGAYGQEVAQTIGSVRAFDRRARRYVEMAAHECGFAYRQSIFKRNPDAFVVTRVRFVLRSDGLPRLIYAELKAQFPQGSSPSLQEVRQAVVSIRRRKSMIITETDPNRRSVGSFFMNPVLTSAEVDEVVARALAAGLVDKADQVPRFDAGGRVKVPAAWLIERSGFSKGLTRGRVGISSAHSLALINLGGGRTEELLALAREVRAGVQAIFGVRLTLEPVVVGAGEDPLGEV